MSKINKKTVKNLEGQISDDAMASILTKKTYGDCTPEELNEMIDARQKNIATAQEAKNNGGNKRQLQGQILGNSRHLTVLKNALESK